MKEDDDGVLVRRVQGGDRGAFATLVERYERPVFNAALRMLRNRDDAQDVTQTVFLKVFEHLADYDPSYRFYSWIYRIALNESINVLNRRVHSEPVGEDLPDGRRGAEDEVASNQSSRRVQGALMTLKVEHRAVIVLKHIVGLSYEDIGQALGLPEKTVKSRLFTARQLLKDALERDGMGLA
jgi:RNA polymerase sigma-70 factor (ECF subfamily)